MDEQAKSEIIPPIAAQKKKNWPKALRVIGWILIGYAGLLFVATVPIALIGGPIAPPDSMSMDEFCRWKESGAWLIEDIWVIVSRFVVGCVLLIIGRNNEFVEPANSRDALQRA